MQVNANVGIHNRFDIEVRDSRTGELKQTATAYNIVLNTMWVRLVNFETYHNNIHFGTGTGTLDATRTTLFTWLGQKTSANEELVKALPTSSWKKKIVLNPEEYVGQTITEVGIGHSATASHIVTHALLQDAEGNPISITKTDIDVVTIYATVFATFSTQNDSVKFVGMPSNNQLVNFLIGGTSFPSCYFYAGELPGARNELQPNVVMALEGPKGNTAFVTVANWVKDAPNKKATTPAMRFGTTVGNGHLVEVGFGSSDTAPVYSSVLPVAGTFTGQAYAGVSVGTGDGAGTTFELPSRNVNQTGITMKVDGVTTAHTASEQAFLAGVAAPATMPGDGVRSCAWHAVGTDAYLAVGASSFTWYKLVDGLLVAQAAPVVMPGSTMRSCAWHTIGLDTYLAVGSEVTTSDRFTWYKLVDSTLVAQAAPATMPGSYVLSCAWHTVGSDAYLAVGSTATGGSKFTWYKLVDGALVAQTAPTTTPGAEVRSCAWHTVGTDTYLAAGGTATGGAQLTWYKFDGGLLVAQAAPTTMPGSSVFSCAWLTAGSDIYLAVGAGGTSSDRFTWYKLDGGLLVAQAAPAVMPGNNVNICQWGADGSGTYLAVGSNTADATKFTWYKIDSGLLVALAAPTTLPGNTVYACAWHTVDADAYLAVGSNVSDATKFRLYKNLNNITEITFTAAPGLITAEAVGTGDGTGTDFALDYAPIAGSLTVKIDGVTTTDYTLTGTTVAFDTAPANGEEITADYRHTVTLTADYTVDGIHKTDQYVVDVSFALQYAEVTP